MFVSSLTSSLLISIKSNNDYCTKRKFISKNEQEQLLQNFYNNLGNDEQEPIEFDGEEKDNDDEEDEEIVGGDYNKPKLS